MAFAQFPRQVSFSTNDASVTGFRLGGTAMLTGSSPTSTDGVLQLTSAANNTAGFAIDRSSFPAPNGFSIAFEFFAYGGDGADGFSVFLIDADKTTADTFTSGATGGSLGYAQKNASPVSPGVPNGYIGIGIDEFGNYANPTEGRVGGLGSRPDAVSIRGSGLGENATSTSDYPYLAGSGTLPFSLDVGTAGRVTDPRNNSYRRAFIDVVPQTDGTYQITVRIQHGLQIYVAIRNATVSKPPANLRIGFSGSTGSRNNFHEIRNLSILQAPIANEDQVTTKYGQPVSFSATANDLFPYTDYNPGSVDLDLFTEGIQSTYTVNGQGTFTVDSEGQVTFTPISTFAGVVTIPYTVQDLAGATADPSYTSSPANLIVVVTGADVATSLSGPGSASPGAQVTYTLNTTNIGLETATNVIPTLQLPTNLTVASSSGYSYDATSGVVTFNPTTLVRNGSVSNSITFTMPANGSVTGTAGYTYPAGATIPDPVSTNNTAILTTTVGGIANVATGCASPGKDGVGNLTSSSSPNTYYPATASAAKGATQVVLGPSAGASTTIQPGDLLLIMQMQGAPILASNENTYGSNTNSGAGSLSSIAGQYEYAVATNAVPATGGTLTLAAALANAYNYQSVSEADSLDQYTFQVIRVPQYSALSLLGAVTGTAWNGSTGGVLAFDVAGTTTFTSGASLTMDGKGFRGGGGEQYTTGSMGTATDYRTASRGNGSKGEGIAGTPKYTNYDYISVASTGAGYRRGDNGRGAPGNAGGGATDYAPTDNSRNTGGGGGANGGGGGLGGYGWTQTDFSIENRAIGGATLAGSSTQLTLGGGGGAGSTNDGSGTPAGGIASSGAPGGGLIIVRTATVVTDGAGTASVTANGSNAATVDNDGGGGGGAGGSVLFFAATEPEIKTLTITTNGGQGGSTTREAAHGPGGGGGGGVIYTNVANIATSAGGSSGYAENGTTNKFGATNGATGQTPTPSTTDTNNGITAKADCLPMLTAALSTTTPNITRTSGNAVNPATYVLTVSNTGGQANSVRATIAMDNSSGNGTASGRFTYSGANTVVQITLANGTVRTLTASSSYTAPNANASSPTFSNIVLPAGATLRITYQAAVASSAVNDVRYQSGATVSYLDPTRTTTGGTVAPKGTYASGGTAPGSNYISTSSTAEDVTITQPLPVELKQFDVAAVRQDAQLTWSTASEKNNDRFEIERSLDRQVFERIGTIKGAGYSTQAQTYRYSDANAARLSAGHPLYYRLRQVDTDGTATYSPVRAIQFEATQTQQATVSVYPNPTQNQATLELTSLPAGSYQVRILDMTGRVLREQTLAGQRLHQLPVAELPMGTYLVQVRGANVSVTLPLLRN